MPTKPPNGYSPSAPPLKQWVQNARVTIRAAVDSARSWEDLTQRLDRDGIVVKLIVRGTRVQGLAFAQGRDPGAPGCGASRIRPRCNCGNPRETRREVETLHRAKHLGMGYDVANRWRRGFKASIGGQCDSVGTFCNSRFGDVRDGASFAHCRGVTWISRVRRLQSQRACRKHRIA